MKFFSGVAKYVPFLKWWLFISLIAAGFALGYYENIFHLIWNSDVTKLSFLIIGLFWTTSLWCGIQTWKASYLYDYGIGTRSDISSIKRAADIGWFFSDLSLSIGMMGTVIGFILMLSGFGGIEIGDVESVQDLFRELSVGMSTALYTTLAGLVCGSLLKIQFFNLDHTINKIIEK